MVRLNIDNIFEKGFTDCIILCLVQLSNYIYLHINQHFQVYHTLAWQFNIFE